MKYEEVEERLIDLLGLNKEMPCSEECAKEIMRGRLAREYAGRKLAAAARLEHVYSIKANLSKRNKTIEGTDDFVSNLQKSPPDVTVALSIVTNDRYMYDIFTDLDFAKLFGLIRFDISERLKSDNFYDSGLQSFIENLKNH